MEKTMYLESGQEVILVEECKDSFIIVRVYDNGNGESCFGDDEIYKGKLFDKPPVEKYNKDIESLKKQIDELKKRKTGYGIEIQEIEKKHGERVKKYNKIKELRQLNMFLNNEIKYYVEDDYWGCKIMKIEDGKCSCDKHDLKLLTLFGRSDGNMEWRLSAYSDGSGGSHRVIPCASYKDAVDTVKEDIVGKLEEHRKDNRPDMYHYFIDTAKKYGIKIDPFYTKEFEKLKKANKEERLAELRKEIKGLISKDSKDA